MQLVLSKRWMFGPMAALLDASFSVRSCNEPQVLLIFLSPKLVLCHTTISYPFITPIAAYIVINSITFDLFSSLPAMVLLNRCAKYPSSAEKNS